MIAIRFASVPEFVKRTRSSAEALAHQPGELGLVRDGRRPRSRAHASRRSTASSTPPLAVPEQPGGVVAEQVDVLVAVRVGENGALAADEGERERLVGEDRPRVAARAGSAGPARGGACSPGLRSAKQHPARRRARQGGSPQCSPHRLSTHGGLWTEMPGVNRRVVYQHARLFLGLEGMALLHAFDGRARSRVGAARLAESGASSTRIGGARASTRRRCRSRRGTRSGRRSTTSPETGSATSSSRCWKPARRAAHRRRARCRVRHRPALGAPGGARAHGGRSTPRRRCWKSREPEGAGGGGSRGATWSAPLPARRRLGGSRGLRDCRGPYPPDLTPGVRRVGPRAARERPPRRLRLARPLRRHRPPAGART